MGRSSSRRWLDLCSSLRLSRTLAGFGKNFASVFFPKAVKGLTAPVVELHALHGEGVGTRLLVLQDPRLVEDWLEEQKL